MDIILYEVLPSDTPVDEDAIGKEGAVSEIIIGEQTAQHFPEFVYDKEEEYVDLKKAFEEFTGDTIENAGFGGMSIFPDDNGDWKIATNKHGLVKIPEKVWHKYLYKETEKHLKVREIGYVGYGYGCDYWNEHPWDATKNGHLRYTYFDPDDMKRDGVFIKEEYRDRWNNIVEKFRKAKEEGRKVFVKVLP